MASPVEAALVSFLGSIAGLASVGDRIEPAASTQSSSIPRIRYLRVGEPARVFSNDGFAGLASASIQVDVIAATYSQAKSLAKAIQDEDGYRGVWATDREVHQLRVFQPRDVVQSPAGGAGKSPYMATLELTVWHSP